MVLATEKRESKEEFCKSLGWSIDIHWFTLTGYAEISELLRAKIEMGPGDQSFDRFNVTILNKNEGVVDSHSFLFNHYLGHLQNPKLGYIQAIMADMDDNKFRWNRCEIEDISPLTNAIEDYIAQFR